MAVYTLWYDPLNTFEERQAHALYEFCCGQSNVYDVDDSRFDDNGEQYRECVTVSGEEQLIAMIPVFMAAYSDGWDDARNEYIDIRLKGGGV